jgi:hypothetical protein
MSASARALQSVMTHHPVQNVAPQFVPNAVVRSGNEREPIRIEITRGDVSIAMSLPAALGVQSGSSGGLQDMRAGTDTALDRVIKVFGGAPAYQIANRRSTRMKVLIHDGLGIWMCAMCLHQGGLVSGEVK